MNLFENLQMMKDANKKQKYSYVGPIYRFDKYVDDIKEPIFTMAKSLKQACNQFCWRLRAEYNGVITIDSNKIQLIDDDEIIDYDDILYNEPNFKLTHKPIINDPKYNYDDEDRPDNYIVK